MIKELIEYKELTFAEKIKQIKQNNPGKFDHLPDPKPVGGFDNLSKQEFVDLQEKIRNIVENGTNPERI